MLITTALQPNRLDSRQHRASTSGDEAAATPSDQATIGAKRNEKAAALLTSIAGASSVDQVRQANRSVYNALPELAAASSNPAEKAVAEAAHQACGALALPTTVHRFQSEALTALKDGVDGPVGPALGSLGSAAVESGSQPGESRRMGRRVLEAVASGSTSPAEKSFAQAVLRTIPEAANPGDPALPAITDESAANGLKVAFSMLTSGVGDSAEKAVARFGSQLESIASTEGNAGKMGLALFESLTQLTQNPNAQAGLELSKSYEYANAPTLLSSQKQFFQNIENGTGLTRVTEAASEWRSKATDTAAAIGGSLAVQGLLYALPPGGMRWIGGLVAGTVVYSAIKGVYSGLAERNHRAASGRRHNEQFVAEGFGAGFKSAFSRGGLFSSFTHASFNTAASSFLGFPWSFAAGPALSGGYTYLTSGAPK